MFFFLFYLFIKMTKITLDNLLEEHTKLRSYYTHSYTLLSSKDTDQNQQRGKIPMVKFLKNIGTSFHASPHSGFNGGCT